MRHIDFVSVRMACFLVIGILIGRWFHTDPVLPGCIVGLGLMILGLLQIRNQRRDTPVFQWVTLCTVIAMGVLAFSFTIGANFNDHYSQVPDWRSERPLQLKISERLKPLPFADRYVAHVQRMGPSTTQGKVLLYISVDSVRPTLAIDDELIVVGRIRDIPPPRNPYQFNYKTYLEVKGIQHQLNVEPEIIKVLPQTSRTLRGIAEGFRDRIIAKLEMHAFGVAELGVIQALLLGQQNSISEAVYSDYKNAGAVHILAVSGLHVGILLLLLEMVLKPLERIRYGHILKPVLLILMLWSFAFLAGLSASVVRAVSMFSFLAYARSVNRPSNTYNVLAWSIFFILLAAPNFLFDLGFQMSYLAVLAIVWIYPKLLAFWRPKGYLIRKAWQLFTVGIAAQLGVLPISLFYFHQFPALFFVSNLLIVPLLGVVLLGGLGIIVLAFCEWLPEFLIGGYQYLIRYMNTVVNWVAGQEAFLYKGISFDGMQVILSYAMIIALVLFLAKPKSRRVWYLGCTVIVFQSWGIFKNLRQRHQEVLVLAHRSRHSVLLAQTATHLTVFHSEKAEFQRILSDYSIGAGIRSIDSIPLKNHYRIGNRLLFVMDDSAVYPQEQGFDYLVITQSPKINFERLLDSVRPKQVIADGSNYFQDVERWKRSCKQKRIPFHYTGEKGAFYFE
ncbi:MAG: ComEC family competence protein [Flavobacteriaceae bacterium]|nr:ComEC family competence protein [Flavobacteriaceae bacterium]